MTATGYRLPATGIALLAFLFACGPEKPAAVKTASSPKPPAWLTKTTSDSATLYFSGAKEGASSLDEGKESALEAARSQAAQYIGVEISAEHSDVMSTEEAENKAKDTVKSRANAMVRSAEMADVYYEKTSRDVGGGNTYDRFDVWVLIRLPRAEIEKERDRQKQVARETVKAALGRYREALAQQRAGDELAALIRFRDVLSQLKGQGQNVETGDKQIATAGQLKQLAQDAAAATQAKVRRAIVIAPDWVAGAVTQALSAKGFTAQTQEGASEQAALAAAKAQGTPWVIVVHATTTPGGRVFAQVAASAALDVRALDARNGAVVASTQKQAKGVGRTPEAAQQAAASEAGLGAGNDLAAALVAKENSGL
ncbi:MAG: hypothetical protein ABR567_07815 [Myxococcales bacterium]|nr:hypothetical protein [Myxococcales bacterium]